MAKSVSPYTWERGFKETSSGTPWQWNPEVDVENDAYVTPPSKEFVTSTVHNDLGINLLRTWPTLYDGTNSPQGIPQWWNPASEVDVLICGGKTTPTLAIVNGVDYKTHRSWSEWSRNRIELGQTRCFIPNHW